MSRLPILRRGRLVLGPLLVVLVGALADVERAEALVLRLNLQQLVERSKYIVTGEVVELQSYWAPFQDLGEVIFTDVKIRVERVLKGVLAEGELTLQVLGGRSGGALQFCPDSPRYEKGEKVLVFAREYNGRLWNTGWFQGKYRLVNGTVQGEGRLPIARDLLLASVEEQIRSHARAAAAASAQGGAGGPGSGGAKPVSPSLPGGGSK